MPSRSLRELTPRFCAVAGEWLRRCNGRGVAVLVFCTHRPEQEQLELWKVGRDENGDRVPGEKILTNAKPGESRHQKRTALDACPWEFYVEHDQDVAKRLDWSPFQSASHERAFIEDGDLRHLDRRWRVMVEEAEKLGVEWSGRWATFREYVHFQEKENADG